jgi:hypothetical protein
MNTIINAVFAEIANCSHVHSSDTPLRACVDSKVESLALTGMLMVEQNPYAKEKNKQDIKKLVKQAVEDCNSLDEIDYNTNWQDAQRCILERGNRLVDMAVDLMTEGITPESNEIYEGVRKKRCSRRKSNSRKSNSRKSKSLKSILRKSNRRGKKSSKRVVWKR